MTPALLWDDPHRAFKRACYDALARSRFRRSPTPPATEIAEPGVYAISTARPPKHTHLVRRAVQAGPVTIVRNRCGSTLVNPLRVFLWRRDFPPLCPWCETADRVRS